MSGYATSTANLGRRCPVCKGTGINPVAKYMVCPKCNGEGWVPHVASAVSPSGRPEGTR